MQFYLNGYTPGDPDIHEPAPGVEERSVALPDAVDVLIVGSGPSGAVLAAQLSAFPSISTRLIAIVERSSATVARRPSR